MDNAMVPQNATADVNPAPNTEPSAAVRPSGRPTVGFASIAPRLPARTHAQMNSAAPTASKKGEPQVSTNLIESMPRITIQTFMAQNPMKQRNSPVLSPTKAGRIRGSVAMPAQLTYQSL